LIGRKLVYLIGFATFVAGSLVAWSATSIEMLILARVVTGYVLRHQPEAASLTLDSAGWVSVDELLAGCAQAGKRFSYADLEFVVETNDKKRFEFDESGRAIRASQGHSIDIDLAYEAAKPPAQLFHGTAVRFLASIMETGLCKMQRHHVHLSSETKVTLEVGARHGKPVLLIIAASSMHNDGFEFFRTTNGVWLTECVPAKYIEVQAGE
ncbi:MAG: RNA 2'-phosphotransferase, partial [Verrucomicrobiota bacterium]